MPLKQPPPLRPCAALAAPIRPSPRTGAACRSFTSWHAPTPRLRASPSDCERTDERLGGIVWDGVGRAPASAVAGPAGIGRHVCHRSGAGGCGETARSADCTTREPAANDDAFDSGEMPSVKLPRPGLEAALRTRVPARTHRACPLNRHPTPAPPLAAPTPSCGAPTYDSTAPRRARGRSRRRRPTCQRGLWTLGTVGCAV
jgi:hypothetical protein